jgi:hypothetical protein
MSRRNPTCRAALPGFLSLALLAATPGLCAQIVFAPHAPEPIAIVPMDSNAPGSAVTVSGAMEVANGKAAIAVSGAITSGLDTTEVELPHRGALRVCASTTVKLATDASVPAGETPGLLMALDHGAIEASFASGHNSDILLTPDFRILIGGPGAADVKVRLGQHGDTCVDNAGVNAPYVLVSSVFEGGAYRVQSGQRVMFEHGSLQEVVDQEKEPCGCPPAAPRGNEFPLAQSEGLAPLAQPAPGAMAQNGATSESIEPLVYSSRKRSTKPGQDTDANPPAKRLGRFFSSIAHFFRRLFGAE